MNRKRWLINTVSVAMPFVLLAGIVSYVKYLQPKLDDVREVAAAHPLNQSQVNQIISLKDLTYIYVNRKYAVPGAYSNIQQVVGKMVNVAVSENQAITPSEVETSPLSLTKGYEISPIISSWIYGVPQTLRRGDKVMIYAHLRSNLNSTAMFSTGNSVATPSVPLKPIFSSPVVVEFAQNSSNQEILNATPQNSDATNALLARQNGTGTDTYLELKLTERQWEKIEQLSYNYVFEFRY